MGQLCVTGVGLLTVPSRRRFPRDGRDARRVLVDFDVSRFPVDVRDEGGAAQVQATVVEHVVRHLEF